MGAMGQLGHVRMTTVSVLSGVLGRRTVVDWLVYIESCILGSFDTVCVESSFNQGVLIS